MIGGALRDATRDWWVGSLPGLKSRRVLSIGFVCQSHMHVAFIQHLQMALDSKIVLMLFFEHRTRPAI